jgi:hypothetical protein
MIKKVRYFCLVALTIPVFAVIACQSPVQELTIAVTHRVFPDYYEEFRVKMGEKFQLSDAEYYAVAVDFVPDFAISQSTGKVISRSDSLKNPAVKIIVFKGKDELEAVWAFQKVQAPHFSRQSMLGFKLLDFKIEDKFGKVEDKPDKTD